MLSRDKNPRDASFDWLKEMGAITDDDIVQFHTVRKFRNRFAHEIIRMVAEEFPEDWAERFATLIALVDKIERWWIVNYEIVRPIQTLRVKKLMKVRESPAL